MNQLHHFIRKTILAIIDWFYPAFKKVFTIQTFRYAVCGGVNTTADIALFALSYNFIFNKQLVHTSIITLKPHIASFLFSFVFTFPLGFYLSRYVVFQETSVTKRKQLFKYFLVVLGCFVLNFIFLKLFIEQLNWYPTPSKIVTTFFVIAFSYLTQKNFTFKPQS